MTIGVRDAQWLLWEDSISWTTGGSFWSFNCDTLLSFKSIVSPLASLFTSLIFYKWQTILKWSTSKFFAISRIFLVWTTWTIAFSWSSLTTPRCQWPLLYSRLKSSQRYFLNLCLMVLLTVIHPSTNISLMIIVVWASLWANLNS